MNQPRGYQCAADLDAMLEVLVAGRIADNGSYYVHPGDLQWWLYYPPLEGSYWRDIYLWEDPACPGRLLGWALISPGFSGYDVYFQPELRGSPIALEMYAWAEEKAVQTVRDTGKKTLYVLWVRHDDEVLAKHFSASGYRLGRGMLQMARGLSVPAAAGKLAQGFTVRTCKGRIEAAQRALSQYAAFASRAPFEQYLRRFEQFMSSPAYGCCEDIVAAAPDGRIAAFCLAWMDPVSRVGLFEPVGTHPDFQRSGLGRAVMLEGLRRMQEGGMQQAILSTFEDNLNAIRFYESMGFQKKFRLGTYEKEV